MLEPVYDAHDREDWDEEVWERFLQRADARTAKFQELFETLAQHPERDRLIAREMGWERGLGDCGEGHNCLSCAKRFDCEAYEMLRLLSMPDAIEKDPEAEELMACFEQLRDIPAYCRAQDFAVRLEDALRRRYPTWVDHEMVRGVLFVAEMVPAQIAGGHGIGYERDSLCGNIANCKRALRNLHRCVDDLQELQHVGVISTQEAGELAALGDNVLREIQSWIDSLRGRIWWQ